MNFFNRYKDLFEVGDTPIPTKRLQLNNQLFTGSYAPTYAQSYALDSKLRELKKDYDQFQREILQTPLSRYRKSTPKRVSLKKSASKEFKVTQGSPIGSYPKKSPNLKMSTHKKEGFNMVQLSEMDQIFNQQLRKASFERNSINIAPQQHIMQPPQPPKAFAIKNREKRGEKLNGINKPLDAAASRRKEAKQRLDNRKEKLKRLLKTAW